jgi:hypothetical protein
MEAPLRASRTAFVVQCAQRDRLEERLASRFQDDLPEEPGYERLFTHLYERFDAEERDLHAVIRAYTEHALAELAEKLNKLDAHLLLWLAKYESWIPDRPNHALVYLADEAEHGLGFPQGIEDTLAKMLRREA